MTAQTLINAALRLIGALAQGETAPAADITDSFAILNAMVDAWRAQPLTILADTRQLFTLTANVGDYTLGPVASGADLSCTTQTRPPAITQAAIIPAGDSEEIPLDIWTEEEWAGESQKASTSTYPTAVHYVRTFPLGTLHFWPVPTTAPQVALYWPEPLTLFATLTTAYSLAAGYEEALKYNLAVRLAPEFGRPLDPTLAALAANAMALIKRANKRLTTVKCDPALLAIGGGGAYNWRTDQ